MHVHDQTDLCHTCFTEPHGIDLELNNAVPASLMLSQLPTNTLRALQDHVPGECPEA